MFAVVVGDPKIEDTVVGGETTVGLVCCWVNNAPNGELAVVLIVLLPKIFDSDAGIVVAVIVVVGLGVALLSSVNLKPLNPKSNDGSAAVVVGRGSLEISMLPATTASSFVTGDSVGVTKSEEIVGVGVTTFDKGFGTTASLEGVGRSPEPEEEENSVEAMGVAPESVNPPPNIPDLLLSTSTLSFSFRTDDVRGVGVAVVGVVVAEAIVASDNLIPPKSNNVDDELFGDDETVVGGRIGVMVVVANNVEGTDAFVGTLPNNDDDDEDPKVMFVVVLGTGTDTDDFIA
jgi:hypothetical protein